MTRTLLHHKMRVSPVRRTLLHHIMMRVSAVLSLTPARNCHDCVLDTNCCHHLRLWSSLTSTIDKYVTYFHCCLACLECKIVPVYFLVTSHTRWLNWFHFLKFCYWGLCLRICFDIVYKEGHSVNKKCWFSYSSYRKILITVTVVKCLIHSVTFSYFEYSFLWRPYRRFVKNWRHSSSALVTMDIIINLFHPSTFLRPSTRILLTM